MKHFVVCAAALFSCFIGAGLFSSCSSKKIAVPEQSLAKENSETIQWFYFTPSGYSDTPSLEEIPQVLFVPWTEAVRVSGADTSSDGTGLMLINRLGALIFNKTGSPVVLQDIQLFNNTTAGSLVFCKGEPFFTVYRNAFFNQAAEPKEDSPKNTPTNDTNRPYVIRIAEAQRLFLPVVTYGDMAIDQGEVTSTYFDGTSWYCSIKTVTPSRTDFQYCSWEPVGSLAGLPAVTRPGKITRKEITRDSFRQSSAPRSFTNAPPRLQELLASIPSTLSFSISCKTEGGASPLEFIHGDSANSVTATAIIAPQWAAAVFSDGTTYFSGALENRAIINNAKPYAFRLPQLPQGFLYTEFCISGDYLFAGWEETEFYRTGRTGFISINLGKTFSTSSTTNGGHL